MRVSPIILALFFWTVMANAAPAPNITPKPVVFRNHDATLHGCIYLPKGKGPFPAIIFNQPATRPSYEKIEWPPFFALAQFFTSNGYAFFLPGRYAHEELENGSAQTNATLSTAQSPRRALITEARNSDVLAGIAWLKAQANIDENRIVLAGQSSGALQALFVAAKNPDIRGTLTFSAGAISWNDNVILQDLMQNAVQEIKAPLFMLQPENDISIEPSHALGAILCKKPLPTRVKIYPPFGKGPTEANLFGINGADVWGKDVLEFLRAVTK